MLGRDGSAVCNLTAVVVRRFSTMPDIACYHHLKFSDRFPILASPAHILVAWRRRESVPAGERICDLSQDLRLAF
jgi:hypothetical protein